MRFKLWIIYGLMLAMFSATVIKMACITVDTNVSTVGKNQGKKTVTVATVRGTFYDRNLVPLVNGDTHIRATFLPEYEHIRALKPYLSDDEYRSILDKAVDKMPLTVTLKDRIVDDDAIYQFETPYRYGEVVRSSHLLGYIDHGTGRGLSGLEKVYDDVLSRYSGSLEVTFDTDGVGVPLVEKRPIINDSTDNGVGGIVLTIDNQIQTIVDETASLYIKKGTAIVMDAQNGEILAMGSYPTFHPDRLEESLSDENEPFVNRAISLYDCGSVFKIVTAMAALEYGVAPERCFDCCGEYTVDETVFHCHNRDGHGLQNMETAFANSCNSYFVQLALNIGADVMQKMIERLGLDRELLLTDGWMTPAAVLPSDEDLSADAALANLSFGQGSLLMSPLQTAVLVGVITSGGNLLTPEVVAGFVDANKTMQIKEKRGGETVVSARTVRLMRRMMRRVVTDGTGKRAEGENVKMSGKTGTAETGQLNLFGFPVVQSWFVGYFPSEQPRYIITVLAEDAQNTGADTALAVCEISNKLYEQKKNGD